MEEISAIDGSFFLLDGSLFLKMDVFPAEPAIAYIIIHWFY